MGKLIIILVAAFLIRFITLNQSLWLDEGTTAKVVGEFSYSAIFTRFSPTDFHPPLFYLVEKLWTSVFGTSEIALRMPSIIFSLLTGWVVYLLGGIWTAVFFLFNPLIVYYSQEARMYMMVTCLLTAAVYYFTKILRINGLTNLLLFTLFSVLSFYTFYGSIFLIVPLYLFLFYKKQYRAFIISGLIFGVSLLVISPLLIRQLANSREALKIVVNWKQALGTVNLKNLLLIPLKFAFGRISFYPKWLYWGLAGIWTIFIWLSVLKNGLKHKLYLYLIFSSLAIGMLFSFFSPLLQYFRFLFLIPLMVLLVDNKNITNRYVMLAGFVVLSLVYLLSPQFYREDWKSLAKRLPANEPIYAIPSSMDALFYYRNVHINDLRKIDQAVDEKLVVIPYTAYIYGLDYKKSLIDQGYKLDKTVNFRGVEYEEWNSEAR